MWVIWKVFQKKNGWPLILSESIINWHNLKPTISANNNNNDNNPSVSAFENDRQKINGTSNVDKTFDTLKTLEKLSNKRLIHITTRSPNQYPKFTTSFDIKPINENKGSVVIFDDMLGARTSSQKDEFFTRGRYENLDVYYLNQSYFGLPTQSIRNNSDIIILFKQTLLDVQSIYYDIGAYDTLYSDFREMFWKVWSEKINFLCSDMTSNKKEGKYRIFIERKNTYCECIPESEVFSFSTVVFD